jgi:hypothetical protein
MQYCPAGKGYQPRAEIISNLRLISEKNPVLFWSILIDSH